MEHRLAPATYRLGRGPALLLAAAGGAAVALTMVGCGRKPHSAPQQQDQVAAPTFPSAEAGPFMLTEAAGRIDYKGNLLVWNPAVTPDGVRAVADAVVDGRRQKLAMLEYRRSLNLPELEKGAAQAGSRLVAAKDELDRYSATVDDNPEVLARRRALAGGWFEARLAELSRPGSEPVLTPADLTAARERFHWYCEAKIWEFAVSPLAAKAYSSRPTPLALCEDYYRTRLDPAGHPDPLLSADAAECQDGASPAGKVYVDCLWRQGIAKSRLLAARVKAACPAPSTLSRQDAIRQFITTGALQSAYLAAVAQPDTMANLRASVLSGSALSAEFFPDLASCRFAFAVQSTPPLLPPTAGSPVAKLLGLAEDKVKQLGAPVKFVHSLLPLNTETAGPPQLARYAVLADLVRVFAERPSRSTPSVSDHDFNHPIGGTPWANDPGNGEAVRQAPEFAAYRALSQVPPGLLAAKDAAVAVVTETQQAVKAAHDDLSRRMTGVTQALAHGVEASMAPGVGLLFVPLELRLVRSATGELTVAMALRQGRGAIGCLSMVSGGSCSPAAIGRAEDTAFQSLRFLPESNQLQIDLLLDDPAAQQVAFTAVGSDELSQISASDLKGKVLRLELYANRLGDRLDIYSGKTWFLDGDAKTLEGSVSGDAFDDDAARL